MVQKSVGECQSFTVTSYHCLPLAIPNLSGTLLQPWESFYNVKGKLFEERGLKNIERNPSFQGVTEGTHTDGGIRVRRGGFRYRK